ncbi:MAG: L-2-hydroxyglutarate oxidase [Acidobacteriota bacterium]
MSSGASPVGTTDVVCVGAGIVGLATALALQERLGLTVTVVEAEARPAEHQTGHNSGVLHSGLYYKPGSLKARNCVVGRRRMLEFCDEEGVPYELCGKLVIATDESEIERLDELERRGHANGLAGVERLPAERIAEFEPHAAGLTALRIPETGIVDYRAVAEAMAERVRRGGGEILLNRTVNGVRVGSDEVVAETSEGSVRGRFLINCAGLHCDRVARMTGLAPKVRIVPFRGEYFDLRDDRRHLLQGLIYPVPDPRFPFLGVHLTRRVDGSVEAGPNAVLAFQRDGYERGSFSLRDTSSSVFYPGLWKLGLRYWKIGLQEFLRAGSEERFAAALRRFVPEITAGDLGEGGCGIRAQALGRDGQMLDDFEIARSDRCLHVLNAPSPAATASLSVGDTIADMAREQFDLPSKVATAASA